MLESERDIVALEREAAALESIAMSFALWCKLYAEWLEKEHPSKREPRDAIVTRVPSETDALKADQGASEETTEEWIGLRERELIDGPPCSAASRKTRTEP